ncbi:MAG: MaoC/PaaZ C-terminal domain-containing protein [Acutalibacteraceae bacterium]|nr:MaoC/PaaZ C-terminal domain-containing protein [Acutalibacteraceae bacterium]
MNEYQFSEIQIGDKETFTYNIDKIKMDLFRQLSGDENPLHTDLEFAKEKGYTENVVYGQLTAAALSTLAGMYLPGKLSIIHTIETNFLKPVFISKCPLLVTGIVKEKDERFKTITLKFEIFDNTNVKVCKGKMRIGFLE